MAVPFTLQVDVLDYVFGSSQIVCPQGILSLEAQAQLDLAAAQSGAIRVEVQAVDCPSILRLEGNRMSRVLMSTYTSDEEAQEIIGRTIDAIGEAKMWLTSHLGSRAIDMATESLRPRHDEVPF